MLSRKCAEWIIGPKLTPELATTIMDGKLQGSDIWNDVCTFTSGWCNDTNVFLAWDAMGRPNENEYIEPEYDMERNPERRRAIVANARISAMAQLIANDLINIVEEILVRDGWTTHPTSEAETDTHSVSQVRDEYDAPGFTGEGHLLTPSKTSK